MTNKKFLSWNQILCCAVIASFAISIVGCANGPIRKLIRGGACNACQPSCSNFGQGGQIPIQSGYDGYSSNANGLDQGYTAGYGGTDLNGSYYPSNIGGATINPPIEGAYGNGSLGGPIVPPAGNGF